MDVPFRKSLMWRDLIDVCNYAPAIKKICCQKGICIPFKIRDLCRACHHQIKEQFWLQWAFHPIFHFSFWLTKFPETKIGCVVFCTMFSVCKARQARQKWKIIKKQTNYYVIILFFVTFVNQNKKRKMGWKAHKALDFKK